MSGDNVIPLMQPEGVSVDELMKRMLEEQSDIQCMIVGILYKDRSHKIAMSRINGGEMAFLTKQIEAECLLMFTDVGMIYDEEED